MVNSAIAASDFLIPKHLRITELDFRRVLVCGSCMASVLVHFLKLQQPTTAFDHVFMNNVVELPDSTPRPSDDYDFQVVTLPLRDVVSDRVIMFSEFVDDVKNKEIRERAFQILTLMFESSMKYNEKFGIPTFILNFPVPVVPVAPTLSSVGGDYDFAALVRDLNKELAHLTSRYKNALLIDVDGIYAAIGKRYLSEEIFGFYTHGTFFWDEHWQHDRIEGYNAPQPGRIDHVPKLSEHYGTEVIALVEALWDNLEAAYRCINQIDTVKMVIFDLDDTVWRGQIAEHYGDDVGWPVSHGWPLGIWETVQHLRARGILVAVASKNEISIVKARWSRAITEPWLSFDDFVFAEINWQPKAENIRHVIDVASLTPKSVVFVDDNPVERESVRVALPGIRVIGSNPFETKRILLWSAETQKPFLTEESKNREHMMRKQVDRERERASMSREDFLNSLECKVDISKISFRDDPRLARAIELLNKTNQFNTTGRRWKANEIDSFFAKGGKIFSFEVSDRYTAYGLVGVIIYSEGHFEQFAMSCRVLGLGIEESVLSRIVLLEASNGQNDFYASVLETSANIVSRGVFRKIGMVGDLEKQILPNLDVLPKEAAHLEISVSV